jgi:hypothetical protein
MSTYTAYFRTGSEYARHEFSADTPEEALQKARAFYDAHDEDLMFVTYDEGMPLEEIEITGPEGTEPVVWQSDDLRVRLAACDLLEALKAIQRLVNEEAINPDAINDIALAAIVKALSDYQPA